VGGYKNMIGEDIDMSIRIKSAGFKTTLIKEAYVFHKRRVDIRKFYKQVNTFGKGRVLLSRMHKGSLKAVHTFPMFFVLGNFLLILLSLILFNLLFLLPIAVYIITLFLESLLKNKNITIAFLSIAASYAQLFGYGLGFIGELLTRKAGRKKQEELYK
jgi:GT2 family glycosyltransferase